MVCEATASVAWQQISVWASGIGRSRGPVAGRRRTADYYVLEVDSMRSSKMFQLLAGDLDKAAILAQSTLSSGLCSADLLARAGGQGPHQDRGPDMPIEGSLSLLISVYTFSWHLRGRQRPQTQKFSGAYPEGGHTRRKKKTRMHRAGRVLVNTLDSLVLSHTASAGCRT